MGERVAQHLHLDADSQLRLDVQAAMAELRADILRASYVTGDFILTGGLRRPYYIDKYLFETRPAILRRLARFMSALVPPDTDRVGAPALGAVAIGTAIALELGLPLVIVRPDLPVGSAGAVKGELYPAETVTLVEDVVVTGSRAMSAIERVKGAGARVRTVVAVVDRAEGAAELFAAASIGYRHLFTPRELGLE